MKTYTQEQLDIALLQSKSDSQSQTLNRIEVRLDSIESNIKAQYSNFTNYILGIYGLILAASLARLGGMI
jgi:hypothetical protein